MHLRAVSLAKTLGDRQLLADASLLLNPGEKLGLVGPNGSGKTTLLRLLAGLAALDAGAIEVSPPTARLGYLPQSTALLTATTADAALGPAATAWTLRPSVETAAANLAVEPDSPAALAVYAELWERFEGAGGYSSAEQLDALLAGLGLADVQPARSLATLSGGTRTRLALTGLLAAEPDALLLDEPTNYLDFPALHWLEEFILGFPGAVLVVSHDRAFLDAVADRILELDPGTGRLTSYPGGYTDYAEAKEAERANLLAAYHRQEERVARLESNLRAAESRARGIEQGTIDFYYRARARKVARAVVVQKRRLEREFERSEFGRIEKPAAGWSVKADLPAVAATGDDVLRVESLAVELGGRRVLAGASLHVRRGERVAIVGANGAGKTTLLRAIVGDIPPNDGLVHLGAGVRIGYFSQGQADLDLVASPIDVVRSSAALDETEARRFLHRFLFAGDSVFTPAERLSYGERARLALARLVLAGANLLVLDEPLAHLDLPSREAFESALLDFGGTLLAVLHDRYSIARIATRVVELADGRLVESTFAAIEPDPISAGVGGTGLSR